MTNFINFVYEILIIKLKLTIHLSLILSGIILIILIIFPVIPDVKIRSKVKTIFSALLYINFYIILLFCLRIFALTKEINLLSYITLIKQINSLSLYSKTIYIFALILLVLFWIVIFIKLQNRLQNCLWQIHFYLKNAAYITTPIYYMPEFDKRRAFYKYKSFFRRYHNLLILFFDHISVFAFYNWCQSRKFVIKLNVFVRILRYGLLILLILGFLLECYLRNFVILYTYYFLILYIIFIYWFKLSFFLYHENTNLNLILFERAYCEPEIMYVNITEKEELELSNYVKNPSDYETRLPLKDYIISHTKTHLIHPIAFYKRFTKTKFGESFVWANKLNKNQIEYFDIKEITTKNGKHFVKTKLYIIIK